VIISPVLAGLAVGIGVPILLFYVYGVVPVSLCRSGGCGVTTSPTGGVRFDFDDEGDILGVLATKYGDTVSHPGGNPSIGEVSLSLGSGSQVVEPDRESASFVALAGSIASHHHHQPPPQRYKQMWCHPKGSVLAVKQPAFRISP
ncbi:hypothetical protein AAG570_002301, partial [Ranatra chinensis]